MGPRSLACEKWPSSAIAQKPEEPKGALLGSFGFFESFRRQQTAQLDLY